MTLKEQLTGDMKQAMKNQAREERDTLRLLLAAVKQSEVDQQKSLSDADVQALLMKQAKQRQESIAAYEAAGRDDLATPEKFELSIIERYLPRMMDRQEIVTLAQKIINEIGAEGPRAMGQVMGKLMPQVQGKADGRLVNEVVRDLLS